MILTTTSGIRRYSYSS